MTSEGELSEDDLMYGLSVWQLKFLGIWSIVQHYRLTGRWNWIIKFKLLIGTLLLVFSSACQVVACFVIEVDLQKVVCLSTQVTICLHVLIRNMVLWFQLGKYSSLLDLLRKDFLKSIPGEGSVHRGEARKIYGDISGKLNLLVNCIVASALSTCFLWCLFPSYSVDVILRRTGDMSARSGDRLKVLAGWYPGLTEESPVFELVYAYEVAAVVWACVVGPVYLCAYIHPLICISAHFVVLGRHISSLKVKKCPSTDKKKDSEIYLELYAAIEDHQKLIRYANDLKTMYNHMLTVKLGLAMYMQTVCLFQAIFGSTKDISFLLKYFLIVSYKIGEAAIFCYGSSYLEGASSNLKTAMYESDWYKADIKFRKAAQMLMVGSSKGITLTALTIYPINLETLLEMFQMVYSAAALMSRMAKNN